MLNLQSIKQRFRLYMNGVTAQSLRDKGVNYHLNWGVSLQHLQEMAAEIKAELSTPPSGGRGASSSQRDSSLFTPHSSLSVQLWQENVRECKILATMLMPPEQMPLEEALQWAEQAPTQEIAELAAMHLYQHLPYAKDMALLLITKDNDLVKLQGYCILARLFSRQTYFTPEETITFKTQARTDFKTDNLSLKHTILNTVQKLDIPLSDIDLEK